MVPKPETEQVAEESAAGYHDDNGENQALAVDNQKSCQNDEGAAWKQQADHRQGFSESNQKQNQIVIDSFREPLDKLL